MDSINSTVGIGFLGVIILALMGMYYWLFGSSKVNENDGRP